MTKESYQFGRSDITSALVAAQLNIQTQTQYLTAVSDYQQALTDLEQAVGKPLG
jgi:outer membrane protein TolC